MKASGVFCVETIVVHFLAAAEWASLSEEGQERATGRGFTKASVTTAKAIVVEFLNALDRAGIDPELVGGYWSDDQLGHDLYLSMIGAGVGLWDRVLDFRGEDREVVKPLGRQLHDLVEKREGHVYATGNGYIALEVY